MKMLVVATYPQDKGPTLLDKARFSIPEKSVYIGEKRLKNAQGITALLGAAYQAASSDESAEIYALLGGDIGKGDGTRAVYKDFKKAVNQIQPDIIVFHYMQPIMALMKQAMKDLDELEFENPLLVADAGGMYAAKAAGVAHRFELMTPDIGEIGFLAEENVPHPAYVSHFLFGTEDFEPLAMAQKAYRHNSAARVLLIKGATDTIVVEGKLFATLSEPCLPVLEAIGGTGDTLTGLCAGIMLMGVSTADAALEACALNRKAGMLAQVNPSKHASDIIAHISR